MIRPWVAAAAGLLLASCASLDFYAPEVGEGWTAVPVAGDTVAGVTVRASGEEYSSVTPVGTLLAPAYQGARKASWTVEGPEGFRATVVLVQTDLVFSGPVDKNRLQSNSIDFSKAKQYVHVVVGKDSFTSAPGPVTSAPQVEVRGLGVKATYQGASQGKVTDYQSWGLVTGLRLTDGDKLVGFLSTTNGLTLRTAPGVRADPLLVGLALASVRTPFVGPTPTLTVSSTIDVFGLKLTVQESHH